MNASKEEVNEATAPELTKENPENNEENLDELAQQILTSEDPKSVLREKLQEIYNDKDIDAILSHIDMEKLKDGNSLKEELAKAGLAAAEEASLLEKATILAANAGQDVADKLEITNIAYKHYYFDENWNYKNKELDTNTAICSYIGEAAYIEFDLTIPQGVKSGDYFVIDYGKYVLPGGINVPRNPTPITNKESIVVATPIYDEVNNRTIYRFTDYVNRNSNIKLRYSDSLWPNYATLTSNNTAYPVDIKVANKDCTKEMRYDYGNGQKGSYAVVEGANVEMDQTQHTLTQVCHVNRDGDKFTDGNYSLLLESDDDDLQTFEVYEVSDDRAFTDSPTYEFNPTYVKKIDATPTKNGDNGLRIDIKDGVAQGKRYIVKTVVRQKEGAQNNVVWLSLRNKDDKNSVVPNKKPGSKGVNIATNWGSSGQGDENQPGQFIENHRYITVDEDGKTISEDDFVTSAPQVGHKNEEYTTSKIDRDGYTYVKVENTMNDPNYAKDGKETKGNYKAGKTLSITYLYQKKVITKGKFQEHHIYQTVDEDGKVISTDSTVDKDETTGTEKESYETAKIDKAGYKLVKVEAKEGGKFDKEGKATKGNYIANKKQEVTYIYQKKKVKPLVPTPSIVVIPTPGEPDTTTTVLLIPKKLGKVSKTGELASSYSLTFYLLMTVAVLLTKQKNH